jgi:hypothetical protein
MNKQQYYICNLERLNGSNMVFYSNNSKRFTCNIDDALLVNYKQSRVIHKNNKSHIPLKKEFVDKLVQRHVDINSYYSLI